MTSTTGDLKGLWLILLVNLGTVSGLFECTAEENGLVSTPNINESYFNHETAESQRAQFNLSGTGTTYIFTIPSLGSERNCSGRVTAIECCYEAQSNEFNSNSKQTYFLSLTKDPDNLEGYFRVDDIFPFDITRTCTTGSTRVCCGRYQLQMTHHVVITASSFSFGIVVGDRQLLAFSTHRSEFNFPQYQMVLQNEGLAVGYTFRYSNQLTGWSLLLLKFILDPDETPTAGSTPPVVETTPPSDTATSSSEAPSTDEETTPGGLEITTSSSDSETTGPPNSDATSPETTPDSTTPPDTTPDSTTPPDTTPDSTTPPETTPDSTTPPETTPDSTTPPETTPDSTTPPETTPDSTPPETTPDSTPPETTPDTTPPATTTQPQTTPDSTPPETTTQETATPPESTAPKVTFTGESSTARESTGAQFGGASTSLPKSSVGSVVGGTVGGVVIGVVVIGIIALTALVVIKLRRTQTGNRSIDNAVYEKGDTLKPLFNTSAPVYAGIGPEVTDSKPNQDELSLHMTNDYAECGAAYETPIARRVLKEGINNQMYEEALDIQVKGNQEMLGIANITYDESYDTGYDDIYVVPASEEDMLYAQLQDIMIPNLTRDAVKLGGELGSGQFGVVYKGVLECGEGEGGKVEVAVKTLKEGSGEEDRVKFLQEAAIMGQFKHHNVVTMYGVVTAGEPTLLVLELLKQGDLRKHLNSMKTDTEVDVDDHTLLSYCRQVASGMVYLSHKAFVHRDLAARNILVSDDDICKIADFGMSRDLADESYYVSHGGKIPVKWTAPEALHFKKYSTASDVWSYGALMYEIWSVGHKPYENYENTKVIRLLESGYRLPPPPGCPRAIYNIMIQCWHPSPSQRPKFQDVSRRLSLPDPKLLKWSEEDKAVHPEAAKLGADLLSAQELYKDLQTVYKPN